MNLRRVRYQQGSLTIERRKNGPAVWVYRWRERGPQGHSRRRKHVVGTKVLYPTKAAAKRAVDALNLDINLGIYAKAVTEEKRQAQDIIAALFVQKDETPAATA